VDEDLDLTFTALASDTRPATVAYWLGAVDLASLPEIDATGANGAMAYQYETEEQADRTGVVMPEEVAWRKYFVPVAPVQLARAWSLLPYAIGQLGSPCWTSVGERDIFGVRAAACAWPARRLRTPAAAPGDAPDQKRLHQLLAVAAMRASDSGRGVLVVTKPGWSYDDAAAISAETARLMRAAGFAVQDRHA
jgi:hypothetical protein